MRDHLDMLSKELRGEAYSKAAHRRQLKPLLAGRSDSSIEYKHGNISAVLTGLNHPCVPGYKPYGNYQRQLLEEVVAQLDSSTELEQLVAADVQAPATVPSVDDILAAMVSAPTLRERASRVSEAPSGGWREAARRFPVRIDYLGREAANASLGEAGERFVVDYERARLLSFGAHREAAQVEQVSRSQGAGAGFDVLSFEPDGRERLIEVKTTRYGERTPFFVSAHEVRTSRREAERYHVYRVFGFRQRPRLFDVAGPIPERFGLEPREFVARLG